MKNIISFSISNLRFAIKGYLLFFLWYYSIYAVSFSGKVIDGRSNLAISDAIIMIEGTTFLTFSQNGEFSLSIPDELQVITLIIRKPDYYTSIIPDIPVDSLKHPMTIHLFPGNEEEYILFPLGNILVTADYLSLPDKAETEYKITRNEIVHFQALDLSKTLELLPGTELQGEFSLDKVKYPVLRFSYPNSMANSYSLLGTKIIVDGLEIHNRNNLNLNDFAPLRFSNNTVFLGSDLRLIPVDNVESISVSPDISSAEEGEFLQGVIKVNSSVTGDQRLLRINRTAKILHSGLQLALPHSDRFKHQLYLFVTKDEKNPRIQDDAFFRAGFQYSFRYRDNQSGLYIKNSLFLSRIFEKYENSEMGLFTHDATTVMGFSNTFRKNFSKKSSYQQNLSLNLTFRDDYTKRYTIISGTILSPLTETGSTIGVPVTDPYFAETRLTGVEYTLSFKPKWQYRTHFLSGNWNSSYGVDIKYDGNAGKGLSLDPLKPPKGFEDVRPRSFKDLPVMKTFSLYTDHKFSFRSAVRQDIGIGLRIDAYNPELDEGLTFRNGVFFNPRIRYRIALSNYWQIRAGAGTNSMSPALYHLYPRPYYHTVLDSANIPQPVVSTYKFDNQFPDLKALQQEKWHIALDFIGGEFLKGTLNLYQQKLKNIPNKIPNPASIVRKNWIDYPNTFAPLDTITVQNSSLYQLESSLWQKNRGIELQFSINLLEPLHLRIQNSLHYQKSDRLYDLMFTYSNLVSVYWQGKSQIAVPVYPTFEIQQENLEYKTFIHFYSEKMGLWISFNGFFVIRNMQKRKEDLFLFPKYLIINQRKENIKETDLMPGDVQKLTLSNNQIFHDTSRPFHYYFNLNVTKSITRGMNVSFSVNNFLDIHKYYQISNNSTGKLNPSMNYSLEMQVNLNEVF